MNETMESKLQLDFEGFFQCRLATDPDPPSERRGVSGYTFAVGCESDLSQRICTQRDEIENRDFRQPFPPYLEEEDPPFGVFVKKVLLDGVPQTGSPLENAAVRLADEPVYEIRNQIVADGTNRLIPVISPFKIRVEGAGDALLERFDPLDPEQPEKAIWQLRPEQYYRRVPVNFHSIGSAVIQRLFAEQTGNQSDQDVYDFYNAYFEARKEYLELQVTQLEALKDDSAAPPPSCPYEVQIQALRTRLFSILEHTNPLGTTGDPGRMEDRLGIQTVWEHDIVGQDAVARDIPGGTVSTDQPWHTRFWMGGWDGDLMLGWMRGVLEVPFAPRG